MTPYREGLIYPCAKEEAGAEKEVCSRLPRWAADNLPKYTFFLSAILLLSSKSKEGIEKCMS